ncbi:carbonic anhydrase [Chitinilyticum piscinae]|uniref:carbonic anhydrase n=1 Tax=Chitinilyticum piscinae TaxID=2866724 RepID=A0A8J7KEF9_9NEIS|nr:carbonic anhydrase family protein [Chitinilyticum piscinae]MBE9609489.1 carbonic anhydrase family protein [Chitinilyticum piscinae]
MRSLICSLALLFAAGNTLASSTSHAPAASHKAPAAHAKTKAASHDSKGSQHDGPVHWSYEGAGGPENWAGLDAANGLCASGRQQSPIDIRTTYSMALDPLQFDYKPTKLNVLNNGHTIQHNIEPGSWLQVGNDRYQLLQFHFHTPSEEAVGGKRYPMVAHLVHKNDAGQLAVVAVFLTQGTVDNPLFNQLWARLPDEHPMSLTFEDQKYNPATILPRDLRYWTLMGSLTTPPCSEGVRWLILKTPVAISKKQLAQFRKEFSMNARPIQPLNERAILDAQ